MPSFLTPYDIGNRALQVLGVPDRLTTTFTGFKAAVEIGSCYDQLRENELSKNLWSFSTRRSILRPIDVDTQIWTPPAYSAATTYSVGSIVSYSSQYWQSKVASNLANTPAPGAYWKRYFGPEAVDLYDSQITGYFAGEIVIVPAAWDSGTTYAQHAVVRSGTTWYVSIAAANLNNAVTDTAWWALWSDGRSTTSWGETANGTLIPVTYPGTPAYYLSLVSDNADNPLDTGAQWLALNGTGTALTLVYPLGAGPAQSQTTANVYRKPYGYLTRAPTQPKGDTRHFLGAPRGNPREDYVLEDDYIVSHRQGPIMIRYVMDFVDVSDMTSLFCEGLACRIAEVCCEPITQSTEKQAKARAMYNDAIRAARQNNSVEIGPIDADVDDFIAVRI